MSHVSDFFHADVLRRMNDEPEINLMPSEWAAIARAIEVLTLMASAEGTGCEWRLVRSEEATT